jgi:hypothetical protein
LEVCQEHEDHAEGEHLDAAEDALPRNGLLLFITDHIVATSHVWQKDAEEG